MKDAQASFKTQSATRCRSRLSSLGTTTMEKCTDSINKRREFRFIKIRDR